MDRVRPSLVVVDVSVEVSLLVRLAGSPLVVVALPGRRQDRAHRTAYDAAETLLAPWPEQTHATDWPVEWRKKVRCVGGISQFDGRAAPDVRRRPGQVLLLWGGGGHGTTRGEIEAAQRATRGWTWLERSPDRPSADLWRELHESDVVVTHGGQNAVADVAASRTPAVVVAQDRPFDEQGATARAVDRLGAAVGVERWPSSGEWPDLLERARAQGGSGWSRWSTGHGADAAARVLDTMAAEPWRAQDIE
ncbi:MAG: glycosyltransferase [Ornithinibacter sp.]